MPYSGPDDDKLPSNVQKLEKPAREKWVKTWNSAFENCRKESVGGGAGSVEKCEADAFKFANGTIKKEAAVEEEPVQVTEANPEGILLATGANIETRELTPAEKAHKMGDIMTGPVDFKPLGGSQTYDEADAFIEAQEQAFHVNKVTWTGQDLIGNVMSDPDVENRPNKLQKVVDGMRTRLSSALTKSAELVAPAELVPEKAERSNRPFQILKGRDGTLRWIGIPTNKFRDRDHPPQIISEAAHKEFIQHLDDTKEFPVLLSWHTPGTRLGVADFADYVNGFVVMGGPIDKTKYAEAERLAEKCQTEDIGMSHGFVYTYSDKANEIIGRIRIWEVSHLPVEDAANVWTSFDILNKEVGEMPFNPKKREDLVGIHGEDFVAALEANAADLETKLTTAKIEHKDLLEDPPDETTLVEASVKAIVESEGFKLLFETVGTLSTTMKTVEERLATVETTVTKADDKAQSNVDKIVSDAMAARSAAFQPSKDGEVPTKEESEADPGPAAPVTGFEPGFMEHLTAAPLVETPPAVPVS